MNPQNDLCRSETLNLTSKHIPFTKGLILSLTLSCKSVYLIIEIRIIGEINEIK